MIYAGVLGLIAVKPLMSFTEQSGVCSFTL